MRQDYGRVITVFKVACLGCMITVVLLGIDACSPASLSTVDTGGRCDKVFGAGEESSRTCGSVAHSGEESLYGIQFSFESVVATSSQVVVLCKGHNVSGEPILFSYTASPALFDLIDATGRSIELSLSRRICEDRRKDVLVDVGGRFEFQMSMTLLIDMDPF
jgi:hypothetical protein